MAKKIIEECIVVGGVASGGHVLGKNRDRNYSPRLEIVREIMDGVEVAYIHEIGRAHVWLEVRRLLFRSPMYLQAHRCYDI